MLRAEVHHLANGPTLARIANLVTLYKVRGGGAQASNLTRKISRVETRQTPAFSVQDRPASFSGRSYHGKAHD
jgi:hypothetical protein